MAHYVIDGVELQCTAGVGKGKLNVEDHGVYIENKNQANVYDIDIEPFKKCKNHPKRPCRPQVTAPWTDGKKDVLINRLPCLTSESAILCADGGIIIIDASGGQSPILEGDGTVLQQGTNKPADPKPDSTPQETDKSQYWRQKIVEEAKYWCSDKHCVPYKEVSEGQMKERDYVPRDAPLDKNHPPKFMDCSEFTARIYRTVLDISIGKTAGIKGGIALSQDRRGIEVKSIADIKPADLIFFDWRNDKISDHVVIYIGGNAFAEEHGPTKPARTRIYRLDQRRLNHISHIRRIIQDNGFYINKGEKKVVLPDIPTK